MLLLLLVQVALLLPNGVAGQDLIPKRANFVNKRRAPLTGRFRMSMFQSLASRDGHMDNNELETDAEEEPEELEENFGEDDYEYTSDSKTTTKQHQAYKKSKKHSDKKDKSREKLHKMSRGSSSSKSKYYGDKEFTMINQNTVPTLSPIVHPIPTLPPLPQNGTVAAEDTSNHTTTNTNNTNTTFGNVTKVPSIDATTEPPTFAPSIMDAEPTYYAYYPPSSKSKATKSGSSSSSKGQMQMSSSSSSSKTMMNMNMNMMMSSKSKAKSTRDGGIPTTTHAPTFFPTIEYTIEPGSNTTSAPTNVTNTTTTTPPLPPTPGNTTTLPLPMATVGPSPGANITSPPLPPGTNATANPILSAIGSAANNTSSSSGPLSTNNRTTANTSSTPAVALGNGTISPTPGGTTTTAAKSTSTTIKSTSTTKTTEALSANAKAAPVQTKASSDATTTRSSSGVTPSWSVMGTPFVGSAPGERLGYKVQLSDSTDWLAISSLSGSSTSIFLYERGLEHTAAGYQQVWIPVNLDDLVYQITKDGSQGGWLTLSGDGSTLALGGGEVRGQVHVFRRVPFEDGSYSWKLQGNAITNIGSTDAVTISRTAKEKSLFGHVLELNYDGSILAISDSNHANLTGLVQVYEFQDTKGWNSVGPPLEGYMEGDHFGHSLALSNDGLTLAVCGTEASYYPASGYCQVHKRIDATGASSWKQLGLEIIGQDDMDLFGSSVALSADGSILAVGAEGHESGGLLDAGRAYVFQYDLESNLWPQMGQMINGKKEHQGLGHALDLSADGKTLIVGAWAGGFAVPGYVEVYHFDEASESWGLVDTALANGNDYDNFGASVSISADGRMIVVGAYNHGLTKTDNTGQVAVFELLQ